MRPTAASSALVQALAAEGHAATLGVHILRDNRLVTGLSNSECMTSIRSRDSLSQLDVPILRLTHALKYTHFLFIDPLVLLGIDVGLWFELALGIQRCQSGTRPPLTRWIPAVSFSRGASPSIRLVACARADRRESPP